MSIILTSRCSFFFARRSADAQRSVPPFWRTATIWRQRERCLHSVIGATGRGRHPNLIASNRWYSLGATSRRMLRINCNSLPAKMNDFCGVESILQKSCGGLLPTRAQQQRVQVWLPGCCGKNGTAVYFALTFSKENGTDAISYTPERCQCSVRTRALQSNRKAKISCPLALLVVHTVSVDVFLCGH